MDDAQEKLMMSLVEMKMPFGKYKGCVLCDLPEEYLLWFQKKGLPPGRLGQQMESLLEIKLNGLEYLFKPLRG